MHRTNLVAAFVGSNKFSGYNCHVWHMLASALHDINRCFLRPLSFHVVNDSLFCVNNKVNSVEYMLLNKKPVLIDCFISLLT